MAFKSVGKSIKSCSLSLKRFKSKSKEIRLMDHSKHMNFYYQEKQRPEEFAMPECRNRLQWDPAALGTMRGSLRSLPSRDFEAFRRKILFLRNPLRTCVNVLEKWNIVQINTPLDSLVTWPDSYLPRSWFGVTLDFLKNVGHILGIRLSFNVSVRTTSWMPLRSNWK